ncbi:MAG TPA: hypothetical protein PKZ12_00205 [Smithellaceae bacterium]|nr:hypothetical protein [Smithellaceae bacterium]
MESSNFEENRKIFLDLTGELLIQNKHPEALKLAEERLLLFPSDNDAIIVKARALIGMDRLNDVRDILQEAENKITLLSQIYLQAGDFYSKHGYKDDAVACYRKFIDFNPSSRLSGDVELRIARLVQENQLALNLDETTAKPEFYTVTLADLYIKQGHYKMAADVLTELLKREPQNQAALVKLASINNRLTQKEKTDNGYLRQKKILSILSVWLTNIGRLKENER